MEKELLINETKTNSPSSNFLKVIEGIKKFAYTDFYFILLGILVCIGWFTKNPIHGFCSLIFVSIVMLLILDDITPLIANIFFAPLMIYTDKVDEFLFMWPTFIPLGIAILFFIIKNGRHKFHFGKMCLPQLAISFALLIGGLGVVSIEDYQRALPMGLVLGIGVLAFYLLVNHFITRDPKRDYGLVISKIVFYVGLFICVQELSRIIETDLPLTQFNNIDLNLGWAVRTNIGMFLGISGIFGLYLGIRYRWSLHYLLLTALQYACLFMSYSRGGILFGFIGLIVGIIFMFVLSKDRVLTLTYFLIVIGLVFIVCMSLKEEILLIIKGLLDRGFDTSNRAELYREAVGIFKEYSFLGAGLGYNGPYYNINDMGFYWFHSTFFQIIACMGLVGIMCYSIFYVCKCKILFDNIKNPFNMFVLAAMIEFEGYSMIDTGTFVPFPFVMLMTVIFLVVERNTNKTLHIDYVDSYNSITKLGKIRATNREYNKLYKDLEGHFSGLY